MTWTPERIDHAHNTVAAYVVDSIEALEALNELHRALEDHQAELEAADRLANAVSRHISVTDYHRSVEMVDAYNAYSAARAGQGEGTGGA